MKKILLIAILATLSTASFAQKFAHVNANELLQLMPEMDKVRADIEAIAKENQDVMKSMYDEYQSKAQQYQAKASTWTPSIKESKEKELVEMQQRLEETQQSMQQEMQQIQEKLTAPVYEKVMQAIQKAGKEGGYLCVFPSISLLYVDSAQCTDLTPTLRTALNIPEGRTLESLQKEIMAKQQAAGN